MTGDRKLSNESRAIFQDAVDGKRVIFIPTVVLWETSLVLKSDPDRLQLDCSFDAFIKKIFQIKTFVEEPVSKEIVLQSHELDFHDDPFDSIIVATALVKGFPLITGDNVIHQKEPCPLCW